MSNYILFEYLPKELVDVIFSYKPQHREYMKHVMEDLMFAQHKWNMGPVLDELTEIPCDNDYCDASICRYETEFRNIKILGRLFNFCCEHCAGEGTWSIRYD